jgi:hypothetical protein
VRPPPWARTRAATGSGSSRARSPPGMERESRCEREPGLLGSFWWYWPGLFRCRFRKGYIGPLIVEFAPAKARFTAGQSSFTAVPGRQHNCFPSALERATYSDGNVANRNVCDFGWDISGRYATPADSPVHDGTPYRKLRVRRWGFGFVHRSRSSFCRAVPNLRVTIRNFCIAVPQSAKHLPSRNAEFKGSLTHGEEGEGHLPRGRSHRGCGSRCSCSRCRTAWRRSTRSTAAGTWSACSCSACTRRR